MIPFIYKQMHFHLPYIILFVINKSENNTISREIIESYLTYCLDEQMPNKLVTLCNTLKTQGSVYIKEVIKT